MDIHVAFRLMQLKCKVSFKHPFTTRWRFGLIDSVGVDHSVINYTTRRGFKLSYKVQNKDIKEA